MDAQIKDILKNSILIILSVYLPALNLAYGESSILLQPGISYLAQSSQESDSGQSNKDKSSSLNLNLTAGYDLGRGFALGFKYFGQLKTLKSAKSQTTDKSSLSSLGVTIGSELPNAWLAASWMGIQPPERIISSSDLIFKNGSGIILDAMIFSRLGRINFGPQVSWIMFKYRSKRLSGVQQSSFKVRDESYFVPYFSAFLSL